jgi:protein gp138
MTDPADIENPGWMDILNQFWDVQTRQMWTAFPGKCVSYDSSARNATIEVLVKYQFGEDPIPEKIPNLLKVPVMLPGNKYATINLPKLAGGSTGLVICANIDITNWITGAGNAVLPTEDRRWNINDGFFIPGVFPNLSPFIGTVDDDVFDINVMFGTKMKIGNDNAELLDMFDQLLTLLQGNVDSTGVSSTGTNSLINAQLATLQTKLGTIKA